MSNEALDVVVAGHICLDVIPTFADSLGDQPPRLIPGTLINIGPAMMSTGGAVSNVGLALHRLGMKTSLVGRVGDDLFGQQVLNLLGQRDPTLATGMRVANGEPTSYSLVISPPKTDRTFFHCPGANDTFSAQDITPQTLAPARLFHFGYPPIMARMHGDGGDQAARMFKDAKQTGLTTSLDMSMPDPASNAGRVDWRQWAKRVLPHVDLFMPSIEELLFMFDRSRYEQLIRQAGEGELAEQLDFAALADLAGKMLDMGVGVVGIKLGNQGLYLRTTNKPGRLQAAGQALGEHASKWAGRELLAPCFEANLAGTTGSGDSTIAGLLTAMLRGQGPTEAITTAVAVGACSVEQPDAVSGVPDWPTLTQRLENPWPRQPMNLAMSDAQHHDQSHLHHGPNDKPRVGFSDS